METRDIRLVVSETPLRVVVSIEGIPTEMDIATFKGVNSLVNGILKSTQMTNNMVRHASSLVSGHNKGVKMPFGNYIIPKEKVIEYWKQAKGQKPDKTLVIANNILGGFAGVMDKKTLQRREYYWKFNRKYIK